MAEHTGGESRSRPLFEHEQRLPYQKNQQRVERSRHLGLDPVTGVKDPMMTTFVRESGPCYAGIQTMFKLPYAEDAREVIQYDVTFMGIPYDIGTSYRPGARFGPAGVRRASQVYSSLYAYNPDRGMDLFENLSMCDVGDVFTTGEIEKSFDQISRAVAHLFTSGTFPVLIGGDHSIAYPDLRGIAPYVGGKIGIIHIDRHLDTGILDAEARMHNCPFYHALAIPNIPANNMVQIGIGGWQVSRAFIEGARERGTHIITMDEVEELGIDKVAEMALELAWKDAETVFLSFDVDAMDGAFCPGTGWPQPGGFLPREAIRLVRKVAAEGLCALEVAEVSPDQDVSDITSIMAVNVILEVLAAQLSSAKLPNRQFVQPNADLEAWRGY